MPHGPGRLNPTQQTTDMEDSMKREAPENTSQTRCQGGKGRPFPHGQTPSGALPWQRGGPSPNPGGRPRTEPEFRARCREVAAELLERLADAAPDNVPDLVRAFEAISDRGGYLTADKDARIIFDAMALPHLSADHRQGLGVKFAESYHSSAAAPTTAGVIEEKKP